VSGSLSPTELKRLHRQWRRRSEFRLALVLDGVQNPFNVGTLLRSAAAWRAESIWLVPPTPEPSHPKVAKTALGCDRLVAWTTVPTGVEAVTAAQQAGFRVVAVELTSDARPLFELDLGPAVCLVLGHEERGVAKDTLRRVDATGYLPLTGKVGSLNVAQAGTAALYEAARQNWTDRPDR
jgi:tRNA (guanosine-2'-O-)-methyltransferase